MIETERLILRGWAPADREPFQAMCSDPAVMEFLGPPQSMAEIDAAIERLNAHLARTGFTFWAVERRGDGAFLGFCGIKAGAPETPIADDIEIGWRFVRAAWGQGYARESAQASLDWAWANLDVARIAAITTVDNRRSRGLMERLGMVRAPEDDFDHPLAPDALKPHVTYRIARPRG